MKNIITLLIVLSFSLSAIATEIPKVIDLKDGDRIHVAIHSQGCFHNNEQPSLVILKDHIIYCGKILPESKEEINKWELTLSDKQYLDKLFHYYTSQHKGVSTTTDTVTVTYVKNGKVIKTVKYIDDAQDYDRDDSIKSFNEIYIQCFKRHKEKQNQQK